MDRARRTEQCGGRGIPVGARLDLRGLLAFVLLIGFFVAQGAALAHAHPGASSSAQPGAQHDGPCAACRVASDAAHGLESPTPASGVVPAPLVEALDSAEIVPRSPRRPAHSPRAPPIV
jgi:hypothetical protein